MKKVIAIVLFLVLALVAIFAGKKVWNALFKDENIVMYSTQKVKTGAMRRTISATGTVEPEELVNVGAQIGGMITTFGKDADGKTVDYGSRVTAGSLLAKIDDTLYRAECEAAEANCLQAEASIGSSEANLQQARAKLELAAANWERAQKLSPQGIMSKSESDSAFSEYSSAKAAEALAEANVKQAKAQLAAATAALSKAKRNIEYCTIASPVDGVIIDRRVNIGQTVNASMNAPSLFLIARDLKRMQVWVSVNEADIGEIRPGGKVEFTVDAFHGRVFKGTILKTRLNATMSQNVVTYVVEIETDNSDGTLLPYLTANVKFILDERENAQMLPNAAFRFTPEGATAPTPEPGKKTVWVKEGANIRPVSVTPGLNDGTNTEIKAGEIPEGAEVITGAKTVTKKEAASARRNESTNPFLPQMPRRQQGARKK